MSVAELPSDAVLQQVCPKFWLVSVARIVEVGVVEKVEELAPKLQLEPLGEVEVLDETKIKVPETSGGGVKSRAVSGAAGLPAPALVSASDALADRMRRLDQRPEATARAQPLPLPWSGGRGAVGRPGSHGQ